MRAVCATRRGARPLFAANRVLTIFSAALAMALGGAASAGAQSYAEMVRETNARTVTVVAGAPGETSLDVAHDLATVLHCVEGLRVVPMAGRSDANNVRDLLFLRGVDLAIVRADVLEHLAESDEVIADLRERLVYVAPLFSQELHLIANEEIRTIQDLEGRLVNIGPAGSMTLAARRVLSEADVSVVEAKFDHALALERVIDGGLDAMFIMGGKPIPLLESMREVTGLRLIPLTPPPGGVYEAGEFTHQDYPTLVAPGDTVATAAAPSVLTSFNWPVDNPRFEKNQLFAEVLFSRVGYLRRPARHPKWRNAELAEDVPGWTRFAPARDALDRLNTARDGDAELRDAGPVDPELQARFEQQLADFGIAPRNAEERRELFRAFLRRQDAAQR